MTKNDYIEKITQNLEHLTKDELKDVSILTTAQYGVRMKVAEKEYIEKEIANLTPQLQQQALPVVPEHVADYISELKEKGHGIQFGLMCNTYDAAGEGNEKAIHWKDDNAEDFARAWLDGYTVAKEKRYEVVFLEDDTTRQILMENNAGYYFIEEESENYGYWKQDFTEMEIKEINEKFWQLSVPVKDEQIEVEE